MTNGTNQGVWNTATTSEWLDDVESWEWVKIDSSTWRKTGICKNCGHTITKDLYQVIGIVKTMEKGIDIACNCVHNHEGRPQEISNGCGFAGTGFSPPPIEQD